MIIIFIATLRKFIQKYRVEFKNCNQNQDVYLPKFQLMTNLTSFKGKCNTGAASVACPDVAFLFSAILIDVRGHLRPCDEETLKLNRVRSSEGVAWGGTPRLARFSCCLLRFVAQRKQRPGAFHKRGSCAPPSQGRKNTGSPSGPDTTTRRDASNAYRAGSVRPLCRKFL